MLRCATMNGQHPNGEDNTEAENWVIRADLLSMKRYPVI